MKHALTALAASASLLAAVPIATWASPLAASAPKAVVSKTCSRGYTHAVINDREKCLRRGEYCTHRYDRHSPRPHPYSYYGYRCIKRDANGRHHLT